MNLRASSKNGTPTGTAVALRIRSVTAGQYFPLS
jgi:hypothetical protein